jgi:hypothetical protein
MGEKVTSTLVSGPSSIKGNVGVNSERKSLVLARKTIGVSPASPSFRRHQQVQTPAIENLSCNASWLDTSRPALGQHAST